MKKNILILISFAIALIYSCNSIHLNPEITKEELKEHSKVIADQKEIKEYIESNFNYEIIEDYKNVMVYKLLNRRNNE